MQPSRSSTSSDDDQVIPCHCQAAGDHFSRAGRTPNPTFARAFISLYPLHLGPNRHGPIWGRDISRKIGSQVNENVLSVHRSLARQPPPPRTAGRV
jgi:hypothetical protein